MNPYRLDLSPTTRFLILSSLYVAELISSLWLAYELRFDFAVPPEVRVERLVVMLWLIPVQILLLALFQQLDSLPGYFSTPDLARMFYALAVGAAITFGVWIVAGERGAPPRGVIAMDFVFCLVGLTGVRLSLRTLRETLSLRKTEARHRRRVAIIGAGDAGAVLAHELSLKPGLGMVPVAFFDDDKRKWHSMMHGVRVLGAPEKLPEVAAKLDIQDAIIAMPSAPAKRIGEIVRLLRQTRLQCKTVPSIDQLASGQVKVSQLRNVEVQDLLGRERVELETENIREILRERIVMVTGAGGSIGSELCRQIVAFQPRKLLLLDRSEPHIFQIEQELINLGHGQIIKPLVGDITDDGRMKEVFAEHHPEVIFHAAAHKHVPMMEHQPGEAIKNNSLGTAHLAELASQFEVDRFVLISTDKAVNPTSVMGATKRLAEMYIQALNHANHGRTKLIAVRFGNVLGSSGSVIPVFQKQIAEGGPVRVTHPDMSRYFMTIPEASMLVLQSAAQGAGGEIFVLDMGKPVKIVDLARNLIELSGLKLDADIQIEFVGMRPGEKLFEEFVHRGENFVPTAHPKISRFVCRPEEIADVRAQLQLLRLRLHQAGPDEFKKILQGIIPEYVPFYSASYANPSSNGSVNNTDHRGKGHPAPDTPVVRQAPALQAMSKPGNNGADLQEHPPRYRP